MNNVEKLLDILQGLTTLALQYNVTISKINNLLAVAHRENRDITDEELARFVTERDASEAAVEKVLDGPNPTGA